MSANIPEVFWNLQKQVESPLSQGYSSPDGGGDGCDGDGCDGDGCDGDGCDGDGCDGDGCDGDGCDGDGCDGEGEEGCGLGLLQVTDDGQLQIPSLLL